MKILPLILCFLIMFQNTVSAAGSSTTLKKGEKAPFPGTLLDAKAVAEILAKTKKLKEELKLKLSNQKEKLKAQHDLKYNLLKIDLSSLQKRSDDIIKLKNEELTRLQKHAFNRPGRHSHWFFAGGVTLGVAVTIAITCIIVKATTDIVR